MSYKTKINNLVLFLKEHQAEMCQSEFLFLVGKLAGMIEVFEYTHVSSKFKQRGEFLKLHLLATQMVEEEKLKAASKQAL